MGEKLLNFFEKANHMGGLFFEVRRLAMKTGITSKKAKDEPDSPENIEKFEKAINELAE